MGNTILERLAEPRPLVEDGATGTMLQQAGLPAGMAPEQWVLERPDVIQGLAAAYADVGSEVVLTCTFGGTRSRLREADPALESRVHEINVRAAQLAREGVAGRAFVAGDMGPCGRMMEPMGDMTYEEAVKLFAEQAAGLAEGGVDLFQIETMSDLQEIQAAVEGARHAAPDIPIFATMTFDTHGRTMMGVTPKQAADLLHGLAVTAFGVNCGRSLEENDAAVMAMVDAYPNSYIIAKPNAGLPELVNGQIVYRVTSTEMARWARKWVEAGVKIVGGCCGSTPEHLRAIVEAVLG
ncbi:MAG TPA: hypothetical protein EYP04_00545 [Anaerolineae bacterium]|nr:hypothetical protein [Anaerolineae bacterium]HIQ05756.1 hypothetical protein [Anaerolineae bacterium]